MIVVRLLGGLGNQMFQYAAARRLAERHRTELVLELSGFESYSLRRYELDAFKIANRIMTLVEVDSWARRCAEQGGSVAYLKEPHFHFFPGLLSAPPDAFLEGYWQSERYFADIAPVLRQAFTLRAPLDHPNRALLASIEETESVSIHVRRKDYVDNPHTHAVHGTCGLDYYDASIDRVRAETKVPHFFVFSDDPPWAAAYLAPRVSAPCTVVLGNAGRGVIDLTLMRHCRHHIVANSSFSWWGAWLCENPGKIVLAPRRWFASSDLDARDLVPPSWQRV